MRISLPGTFVVLQGMPGDGIINSIDTMPIVDYMDDSAFLLHDHRGTLVTVSSTADSLTPEVADFYDNVNHSNSLTSLVENEMVSLPFRERVECALESSAINNTPTQVVPQPLPIIVNNNISLNNIYKRIFEVHSTVEIEAIDKWKSECLRRATSMDHQQMFKSCNPQTASSGASQDGLYSWWASKDGKLLVFDSLPFIKDQTFHLGSVVHALPPGASVNGDEMIILDNNQFNVLCHVPDFTWDISKTSLKGLCLFLKITDPCEGYILFNFEGYYFAGFGQASDYTSPHRWMWRVSYAEGALVRKGLELDSDQVVTVPFGGVVRVCRKTVNDMGLSRLGVECIHDLHIESGASFPQKDITKSYKQLLGWVSEFLNPLSGRRGNILQPLAFPIPVLYRVRLQQGAIIRAGIELSSQEIGHAPFGSVLSIIGRSFTEHPKDNCLDRLKLAGNGGWISLRLNRRPPDDDIIVEMVSIDTSFDPYRPELYHLEKQRQMCFKSSDVSHVDNIVLGCPQGRDMSTAISTVDVKPYYYPLRNCMQCSVQSISSNRSKTLITEEKCLICLTDERTATLVHGETGHIACCLGCARILKARGDRCPVCRLPIDLVIQHFIC